MLHRNFSTVTLVGHFVNVTVENVLDCDQYACDYMEHGLYEKMMITEVLNSRMTF